MVQHLLISFQNLSFLLLNNQDQITKINYWRTKDKAEVDFIASIGATIIPIEVKYSDLDNVNVSKSFVNFINKYNPKIAFVVNKSFNSKRKIRNTRVFFIPSYLLMDKNFLQSERKY